MKKLLYLFLIAMLAFSCEIYNDQFEGYDDNPITIVENIDYTLTDDDYASMDGDVADNYYFSESDPANDYIPDFLAVKYPALDKGSAVKVTYNYKNDASYLDSYTNASKYTLTNSDYASVSLTVGAAGHFSPSNPAGDYISSILSNSVTDATNGDVYIVSYKYSDIDPQEFQQQIIFQQIFTSNLGVFNAVNVLGSQEWYFSSYQSDTYAKISGFSGGAKDNEDWLISPQIDLAGYTDVTVDFTQTAKYVYGQWEQLSILVSTNYNGTDPSTATWTTLTIHNLPSGNDYTFVNSGNIDLSAFEGQKIHIAFKYLSSTSNAATWEITDITVKGTGASKSGIIADVVTIDELYTYNSSWKKTTGAYYLTSLDYDAMGEDYDQPGKYNNFSSSIPPINYLPKLAKLKYPYAQEGDTIIMVYKYYDSETLTKADKLFYTDNEWRMIIEKTDQYILSTSGWVFDPTVNYTMVSEDYQIIVDYVKANIGENYISSYGNNEYYYGSNAHYVEFQIGQTYYETEVFSTWEDAVKEAIGIAFLPSKYPSASALVDGIDVNYKITFVTYLSGVMTDYTITFQCTKSGPNPEFTYVKGPIKK